MPCMISGEGWLGGIVMMVVVKEERGSGKSVLLAANPGCLFPFGKLQQMLRICLLPCFSQNHHLLASAALLFSAPHT